MNSKINSDNSPTNFLALPQVLTQTPQETGTFTTDNGTRTIISLIPQNPSEPVYFDMLPKGDWPQTQLFPYFNLKDIKGFRETCKYFNSLATHEYCLKRGIFLYVTADRLQELFNAPIADNKFRQIPIAIELTYNQEQKIAFLKNQGYLQRHENDLQNPKMVNICYLSYLQGSVINTDFIDIPLLIRVATTYKSVIKKVIVSELNIGTHLLQTIATYFVGITHFAIIHCILKASKVINGVPYTSSKYEYYSLIKLIDTFRLHSNLESLRIVEFGYALDKNYAALIDNPSTLESLTTFQFDNHIALNCYLPYQSQSDTFAIMVRNNMLPKLDNLTIAIGRLSDLFIETSYSQLISSLTTLETFSVIEGNVYSFEKESLLKFLQLTIGSSSKLKQINWISYYIADDADDPTMTTADTMLSKTKEIEKTINTFKENNPQKNFPKITVRIKEYSGKDQTPEVWLYEKSF